jgi:exopolysaccharide production protein ExoQ
MPPTLALSLCTVFVLFLLRIDRKVAPQVSNYLWIPTTWMLCIASRPLGAWFGETSPDDLTGSLLNQVVWTGTLCLGLLVLIARRFDWSRAIKNNAWLFLLISYMFVSIIWSDIPYISLKRCIRELIAIVMAFMVLSEDDPRQAVESILRRSIYILIPFSLLLIKYYPEYGIQFGRYEGERMWIGVTLQKNGIGRLCIISALFLIWASISRWQGKSTSAGKHQNYAETVVLIITIYLLKGPPGVYPATATVALGVGLCTLFSLLWMKKHTIHLGAKVFVVIIILIIGLGIVTPMVAGLTVSEIAPVLGRSETLTGRTEIWARLLIFFNQNPILGYGFGGFWTPETQEAIYRVKEAHNGYLEVGLGLGVAGLILTSICLISWCLNAQRTFTNDYDWASLFMCYLIIAAIHNIGESSFDSFQRHLMAVLLFLSITVSINLKRKSTVDFNSNNIKFRIQ